VVPPKVISLGLSPADLLLVLWSLSSLLSVPLFLSIRFRETIDVSLYDLHRESRAFRDSFPRLKALSVWLLPLTFFHFLFVLDFFLRPFVPHC